MPIYAYKCGACGFAKDVLQKISEAPLTVCPACGEPAFSKQVTAAGFQLKGSGWYATDFKGAKPATGKKDGDGGKTESDGAGKPSDAKGDDKKNGSGGSGDALKSDTKPASDNATGSSSAAPAVKPSRPAAPSSGDGG